LRAAKPLIAVMFRRAARRFDRPRPALRGMMGDRRQHGRRGESHDRNETGVEMGRVEEPPDGDERSVLLGWLAFHRDALAAKCAGLEGEDLVVASTPPSKLTLLGLVRHLTEMERVYVCYALGPPGELDLVYGNYEDGGPEWDFDVDASMVAESFAKWEREQQAADALIELHTSIDAIGTGNGRSVRWNLQKVVGEYARHNGHADLVRERIDGATGE
jgi:Protein of unknown function (DUF664)